MGINAALQQMNHPDKIAFAVSCQSVNGQKRNPTDRSIINLLESTQNSTSSRKLCYSSRPGLAFAGSHVVIKLLYQLKNVCVRNDPEIDSTELDTSARWLEYAHNGIKQEQCRTTANRDVANAFTCVISQLAPQTKYALASRWRYRIKSIVTMEPDQKRIRGQRNNAHRIHFTEGKWMHQRSAEGYLVISPDSYPSDL
ncbi:hypothetical protein T265_15710, partial [Opisthorchis viverrini]